MVKYVYHVQIDFHHHAHIRTVQKRIEKKSCGANPLIDNEANVCLKTIYPKTFIWKFKYSDTTSTKELEYDETILNRVTENNGHFMGNTIHTHYFINVSVE